jgi:murein DD-endopeptidase MepM/ murein hydrolase activator NlpD
MVIVLAATAAVAAPVVAQEDPVSVVGERQEDGSYHFYASSTHMIPTYVRVSFESLTNLEADVSLPFTTVLEPGADRRHIFSLEVKDERKSRGYRLAWTYVRGNPETAEHDDSQVYLFPFEHGTKHRVTQGFQGDFTHFGENEYGVDFDLDRGTKIFAARDGVVVEVKEDSSRGGASASYSKHGNYILVYHDDGSFGNYVHLRKDGARVEQGARVSAGEHIGYSGATGRASGPHLHFDVRLPQPDGTMQSIPIEFLRYNGKSVSPEEGRHYYAYHPGNPDFEVTFGRNISNEDYADHQASVEQTNKIEFRTEQVDSTYIAFVVNGYDREVTLEVEVIRRGMTATRESPITITVPALTERFLVILRPEAGVARAQYGFNARSVPGR